ncbi:MAG: hypothetical protein ABSE49_26210, partial [Polyangiaceae bacterium]
MWHPSGESMKHAARASAAVGAACALAWLLSAVACTGKETRGSTSPDGAVSADGGVEPGTDAGGSDGAGSCVVAVPAGPAAIDSGPCTTGELVAAPTSTITTPDPFPGGLVLAGSSTGDRFLAAWTDEGPAPIWASL